MLVRFLQRFAIIVIAVVATCGCSGSAELSAEERTFAVGLIEQRSMDASIDLSEDDLQCVVDRMSPEDLDLASSGQFGTIADHVVSCVGSDLIGQSILRSQADEIGAESLACAVAELDRRFVVDLVAGAMSGDVESARSEIEVARVLSTCLTLDELL